MMIKENTMYHVKDRFTNEDTHVSFAKTGETGVWIVWDEYWDEEYILDEDEIQECFIFE